MEREKALLDWIRIRNIPRDPPVKCATWWRPHVVELDEHESKIRTRPYYMDETAGTASANSVLARFVRLSGASDAQVVRFVRKYGPLDLCSHGIPASHSPSPVRCGAGLRKGGIRVEATAQYREYATLLASTLRVAECHHAGSALFVEDVEVFAEHWRGNSREHWSRAPQRLATTVQLMPEVWRDSVKAGVGRVRLRLTANPSPVAVANWWLDVGAIYPRLSADSGTMTLTWPPGAWGAIGAQLVYALMREHNTAPCANCGASVRRARRPNRNRDTYCNRTECQTVAARRRKQRQRARERRSQARHR